MKKISSLFILLSCLNVFAFPEMIRHGYTNCTACHISPTGGGVLNQYGRSLSKEILSTWAYEGEENFLHGLVDTTPVNDWLVIGGDLRLGQFHKENDFVRRGQFIKMQSSIELGINQPKWAVVGSFGRFDDQEWATDFTRYYALYRVTDEFSVRAGRILPAFGINNSEHILSTRAPLGFSYEVEKDTAEISWLGENWNFAGSYYQTPKKISNTNESGMIGLVSKIIGNYKIGLQLLSEKNDFSRRQVYGVTGLLGWNEHLYTTVEFDQSSTDQGLGPKLIGNYFMHRSGYEVFQGFHVLILNDYLQTDENLGSTKNYKFGPGLQWYPRPHFDFELFWTRQQSAQNIKTDGDYAWLILHYYL